MSGVLVFGRHNGESYQDGGSGKASALANARGVCTPLACREMAYTTSAPTASVRRSILEKDNCWDWPRRMSPCHMRDNYVFSGSVRPCARPCLPRRCAADAWKNSSAQNSILSRAAPFPEARGMVALKQMRCKHGLQARGGRPAVGQERRRSCRTDAADPQGKGIRGKLAQEIPEGPTLPRARHLLWHAVGGGKTRLGTDTSPRAP